MDLSEIKIKKKAFLEVGHLDHTVDDNEGGCCEKKSVFRERLQVW